MRHGGQVIVNKFSTARVRTDRTAAPAPSARTVLAAAPPAPPEIPSNAPTGEFRSHHEVLAPRIDEGAFRPGWLVKSRLLGLYETGQIDRYQYEAALWWRGAIERIGRMPIQKWTVRVDGSSRPGDGLTEATINAATALRSSALAIGPRRCALLLASVVQDRSWRELGRQLALDKKTAQNRVVEAIGALGLWRRGEAVPPCPQERFRVQPGSW
jgi:hypothetical protein